MREDLFYEPVPDPDPEPSGPEPTPVYDSTMSMSERLEVTSFNALRLIRRVRDEAAKVNASIEANRKEEQDGVYKVIIYFDMGIEKGKNVEGQRPVSKLIWFF